MKNLWTKLTTKAVKSDVEGAPKKSVKSFYATIVAALVLLASVATPIAATEAIKGIGKSLKKVFEEVYKQALLVVTIIACAIIAICLILRMVSKNPRTAEEATSWAKRVFFTWVVFLLISVLIKFGTSLANDAGAKTSQPWGK